MDKLTDKDLEVLIEAMDSWVMGGLASLMTSSLMKSCLVRNDPVAQEKFMQEQRREQEKYDRAVQGRKRTATLLKAKLIMMQEKVMDSPSGLSFEEVTA